MKLKVKTLKDVVNLGYDIFFKEENVTLISKIMLDESDMLLKDLDITNFKMMRVKNLYDKKKDSYQLVELVSEKIILDNTTPEEIIRYFNDNTISFHPGVYIKDFINSKNMTIESFAKDTGLSANIIRSLISYEIDINISLAERLMQSTGVSIGTWMNLQQSYEESKYEQ